jgi:hypothetical protein
VGHGPWLRGGSAHDQAGWAGLIAAGPAPSRKNVAAIFARYDIMLALAPAIVAGAMMLVDERTPDGSRHFACLPQAAAWAKVCGHALLLPGAELSNFVSERLASAWLEFRFRQHCFRISARDGRFRLFVRDPLCSDLVLYQVGCHFEQLLAEPNRQADLPRRHAAEDMGPGG